MTRSEFSAVREALEHVRESATLVFEALLTPYEALDDVEPDVVLGIPVDVPEYVRTSAMRAVTDQVTHGGRGAWALEQLGERERQIQEFVHNYRRGLYSQITAADWVAKVRRFRDAVLADINTALQAPRGWDRLDLSGDGGGKGGALEKDFLTPKDVAPELGIGERSVRRRIQAGKLGPWSKQGSRWVISKDAFLRFWGDQLVDSDVPRPLPSDRTDAE